MPLIQLILILAIVGFLCWLVVTYIPMPPQIRQLIVIAVVVIIVLYLVTLLFPGLNTIRVGR